MSNNLAVNLESIPSTEKVSLVKSIHNLMSNGKCVVLDKGKIVVFGNQGISNITIITDLKTVILRIEKSKIVDVLLFTGLVSKLSKYFKRILAQIYAYTITNTPKVRRYFKPPPETKSKVASLPWEYKAIRRFRVNSSANARMTRSAVSDDIIWGKAISHSGDLK